jgi:2-polyprenyl-3-methyl-5-hydroxy-6-metoxy-1,4-benzoquinol methylase
LSGQNYDAYFDHEIDDEERLWWGSAHDRMFHAFGERFLTSRTGTIVDVGAGLGYFLQFAQMHSGWKALGYEISPAAVDYARNELRLQNVFVGRVEDSGLKLGSVHVITLWDVLEHIPDPGPLLHYLNSLLVPDGILFIATPNGPAQLLKARAKKCLIGMRAGSHYMEARDHMNLYNTRSLARTLSQAGFGRYEFQHLPPIQMVAGSTSASGRLVKNAWFRVAKVIGAVTANRVNVNNNLYVAAHKA